MNIRSIKQGIAKAAAAVDGLNTYAFCPDSITEPCLYAGEVDVAYHETYGGDAQAVVTVYLLVSTAEDDDAQALLDRYLSVGNPESVIDAIEGTPGNPQTLGGVCDDLVIMTASGYRKYTVGTDSYFGVKIPVRVIGTRAQE